MTLNIEHEDRAGNNDEDQPRPGSLSAKLVFGLVCALAISLLGIVWQFVLPRLEVQHQFAETSVIGWVKAINSDQNTYFVKDGGGQYGSLDTLHRANFVTDIVNSDINEKYRIEVVALTDAAGVPKYWIKASPVIPGVHGDRYFYSNESGMISYALQDFQVNKKTGKPNKKLTQLGSK